MTTVEEYAAVLASNLAEETYGYGTLRPAHFSDADEAAAYDLARAMLRAVGRNVPAFLAWYREQADR